MFCFGQVNMLTYVEVCTQGAESETTREMRHLNKFYYKLYRQVPPINSPSLHHRLFQDTASVETL